MTLRQFTEQLNDKTPNNQEADSSSRSAVAQSLKRADEVPANGFALVVDGIFKKEFESGAVAQKAAIELLKNYPTLRVEVYDASTKVRTLVC
jgi:hypothetical protein